MLALTFPGSVTSGMCTDFFDPVSSSVVCGKELSQRTAGHTVPGEHPENYGSQKKFLRGNQRPKSLPDMPHFTEQIQNRESK